jgi:hypothetical protein
VYHPQAAQGSRAIKAVGQGLADRQPFAQELLGFVIRPQGMRDSAKEVERECHRPAITDRSADRQAFPQQAMRFLIFAQCISCQAELSQAERCTPAVA